MQARVRTAERRDIDQITALIGDRIGSDDAREAEIVLSDEFFQKRWFVAEEDDRILSCAGVFPGQLHIGGVTVGAGAVEFVATHEDAEGRGLVRLLMDEIHSTAPSRGEMVQWIVGITYFYRQFGYEYAIPVAAMHNFAAADSASLPAGWSADRVSAAEIPDIAAAQTAFARKADVALTANRRMWDIYHDSPVYEIVSARRKNETAYGRIYRYEDDRYLFDVLAESTDALAALISEASAGGTYDVTVLHRHGADRQFHQFDDPVPSGDAYYVRVADPAALLDAMRPVLSDRLASHDSSARGEALLSLYSSSIRFNYKSGQIGTMRRGPAEQAPIGQGGSGIAPDRIVSLLLGPLGAEALAALNPDVNLGDQEELMKALFPPQTCDVHSWVFP